MIKEFYATDHFQYELCTYTFVIWMFIDPAKSSFTSPTVTFTIPRQQWRNVICVVLSLALNASLTLLFFSPSFNRFASTSFVSGRKIAFVESTRKVVIRVSSVEVESTCEIFWRRRRMTSQRLNCFLLLIFVISGEFLREPKWLDN